MMTLQHILFLMHSLFLSSLVTVASWRRRTIKRLRRKLKKPNNFASSELIIGNTLRELEQNDE